MQLNDYQKQAMTTCMESSDNFSYMMLNLMGEIGELSSKVAKRIRKGDVVIEWNRFVLTPTSQMNYDDLQELKKELGDILWQVAGLCRVMGWDLEDVAKLNLAKLALRKALGTIDGSGDGVSRKERL